MSSRIRVRSTHKGHRPVRVGRVLAQTAPVTIRIRRGVPSWVADVAGVLALVVTAMFAYGLGVIS